MKYIIKIILRLIWHFSGFQLFGYIKPFFVICQNFRFQIDLILRKLHLNTLLKSKVTGRDHVVRRHASQECGSRFVNFACKVNTRWHESRHNSEIDNIGVQAQ